MTKQDKAIKQNMYSKVVKAKSCLFMIISISFNTNQVEASLHAEKTY